MLYEDRLPEGYAYVRFVNATAASLKLKPDGYAEQMALGATASDRVSNYFVVENVAKRRLTMKVEPAGSFDFELAPGALQTVLIETLDGAISVRTVTDRFEMSQTKAQLSFYNATTACAASTLYLEPSNQIVFTDVKPDEVKGRVVNPAPNPQVRASCGGEKTALLALGALNAGGQYSVWLIKPLGDAETFLASAKFAPYQR